MTTLGPDLLLRWLNWGIEALWISAVVLVPLAFLDRQYSISEAVIAYVEVPKVTLLRSLAMLIAIFWLLEWAIINRSKPFLPLLTNVRQFQPGSLFPKIIGWLRAEPSRWLWLAVWFYFATVLFGTIFSAAFSVSLWGEIPGQDGYSSYTIMAYAILFGAIATHLKNGGQLWRLVGAIVAMGVLVGSYAVLQKSGHDFLNLLEFTGGSQQYRVTGTMGNAIFAAAVMSMTIPCSLLAAAASLRHWGKSGPESASNLRKWLPVVAVAGAWILILMML